MAWPNLREGENDQVKSQAKLRQDQKKKSRRSEYYGRDSSITLLGEITIRSRCCREITGMTLFSSKGSGVADPNVLGVP